jgi:cellulose synthase/poly-beta-1,6-N-acetylglucosamine synthase-like glycosyltransferase
VKNVFLLSTSDILQANRFTATEIIQIVAFVYGTAWLAVTLYTFLPLLQYIAVSTTNRYTDLSNELGNLVINTPNETFEQTPEIDVFVPAYNDANVVDQAISSLRATEYPNSELNINVLIEPDDSSTSQALVELAEDFEFTTFVVPESYPLQSNKPRALDYGFSKTSGDIVGVIDAEDIVDPNLFKYVVTGLVDENKDFVQGRLDMINENDGWKNLLFRGEYAYWYTLLLKGFYSAGYPVPLGGTTNFFHRSTLNKISQIRKQEYGSPWPEESAEWFKDHSIPDDAPWDPLNVTEDFELGLLLWVHDFDIGYLNVATLEESPLDYRNWITQRTRWEKGKIYTMFQWFRYPPEGIGKKFHLLFQSFLPHYAVINVTGIVLLLMYSNIYGISLLDRNQLLLLSTLAIVVLLAATHSYAYYIVSNTSPKWKRSIRGLIIGLTLPIYWALYWAATLRAIYQIYTGNLIWEKTKHHGRNKEVSKDMREDEE